MNNILNHKMYLIFLFSILLGCSKTNMNAPVDFKNLNISHYKPNFYLICPKVICGVDGNTSPIYKLNSNTLYHATLDIIQKKEKTTITYQNNKKYQLIFIQKTRFFRFPDYIDIQIFPVGNNESTIAIFSRAKYGFYDFGINKSRVINIITELSNITANNIKTKSVK